MKTRIIEKIYSIDENQGSDLIPSSAISAIVDYDEQKPIGIYFVPKHSLQEYQEGVDERVKSIEELNPPRSREEVLAIVNELEKSLE